MADLDPRPKVTSRRTILSGGVALAAAAATGGCHQDPNAMNAGNAPPNAATSGSAFVLVDVYSFLGGIFGNTHGMVNALFVNTEATPNPFYLRTPSSMKLNTVYERPWQIFKIDPGTYHLVEFSKQKNLYFFSMNDTPVTFTVGPGELVYLGSLQVYSLDLNPLNLFEPLRTRFTFNVVDELETNRARIGQSIAALPGAPPLTTRLLTVLRPDLEMLGRR